MVKFLIHIVAVMFLISSQCSHSQQVILRTAAQEDTAPKFIKRFNHTNGMCIDLFHEIEKEDPSFKIIGTENWAPALRIYEYIKSGQIDIACGITDADNYQNIVIKPAVFTFQYKLIARKEDAPLFHSIEDIQRLTDNKTILAVCRG